VTNGGKRIKLLQYKKVLNNERLHLQAKNMQNIFKASSKNI